MILRSVIAALAGFILLVGVITTPLTPIAFSYLALGHSLSAAALASAQFFAISWVILDLPTAIASTALFALPALWLSQRALLSRKSDQALTGTDFYPIGRLLLWISAFGIGFTVLIFSSAADQPGGLPAVLAAQFSALIESIPELTVNSEILAAPSTHAMVVFVLAITPSTWMLSLASGLFLGQKLAERFGVNRRPGPNVYEWLMPPIYDIFVLILFLLAFTSSGTWQVFWSTITICAVTPYFLLGLSVIHAIAMPIRGRVWFLAAIYLALLSFLWAAIPVIILGLLESRWALRPKFVGPYNADKTDDNRP